MSSGHLVVDQFQASPSQLLMSCIEGSGCRSAYTGGSGNFLENNAQIPSCSFRLMIVTSSNPQHHQVWVQARRCMHLQACNRP